MNERFTDRLYRLARPVWEAQHSHPFVRGIGDGSLDIERFKFWVCQDYLFLIDYARLLALAVARAPDLDSMRRFADLVHGTLNVEMNLHQSYAAEFGISTAELEAEEKAPTTRGYTDFLLRVAALDEFSELIAALLPCMWGFSDIGQRLAQGPRPEDDRYAKWIGMYSSEEFAELAVWCRALVDRVAAGLPEETLRRMEDAFLTSSRYELLFWEMAWRQERWPA
ncbi:MAG: thiaminase II [Dehalococcoidia bacterium]|nr:thiaminase II [Dehalococcoidia bacterium]